MTVESMDCRTRYATDGVQKTFPVAFRFLRAEDLGVYWVSPQIESRKYMLNRDYSVKGDENGSFDNGGTVLFFNAPPVGKIAIVREIPYTQESNYTPNGDIPAETLEGNLDKAVMLIQQLLDQLSRCIKVSPTSDFDLSSDYFFDRLDYLLTVFDNLEAIYDALRKAQALLNETNDIADQILAIDWESYAPLHSPAFTGAPTAPTAGQGTNTDQLATTAFVQNELTEMIISTRVSFGESQWLLDDGSGKYYLDVVTQAPMFNHIYKTETDGALMFDDSVEVHMKDEGYIHLVASAQFAGYLYTLAPRQLPTFSFSPVDSPVTSLSINGLVTNPMNVTEFTLPSSAVYNGVTYPVTEIGVSAFAGNSRITKIVIGEGIQKIQNSAFARCIALTSLTLPDSMREIGPNFLYGATNLTSLTLNNGLETIRTHAFQASALTTLHIPASVTLIEPSGAWGTLMTSVTVDSGNLNYKSVDGCLYSKDGTVFMMYPPDKSGTAYTVPSGVKIIDREAFHDAVLTSLTLPDGCEEIGIESFFNANIGTLSLPGSVAEIDQSALDCHMETIVLRSLSTRYAVNDGILYDNQENAVVRCPTKASVLGDGSGTLTVPAGIVQVNKGGFRGCKINTLNTNEVETIGENALRHVDIEKLVIGNALTDMYGNYQSDIASVEISAGNTHFKMTNNALLSADGKIMYYYPHNRTETQYTAPSGVEELREGAFWNYHLTSLTLPDSLKLIKTYAIEDMQGLTTLNLGSGLQTLQVNAITSCNALTSLTFPASIQTMATQSVVNLANLTDVTFLGTGTWSMQGAIGNCPKLLRIHGYSGSTAEAYALANNYLFVPLD